MKIAVLKSVPWIVILIALTLSSCAHHRIESAHHGFSDIDQWVKVFEDPARDAWQKPDDIVKALDLKPGDSVADIGAGTGYFTRRFAVAVGPQGKALGLDVEPTMVGYMEGDARKRKLDHYEARLVRADNPGLPPESVDIVFFCDTYHHIENRVSYLINLSGALKPGGRIVIVDFHKRPLPIGPPPEHKLSEETVRDEFQRAGYRLIRAHDFLPYQYFLEFTPR